LEYIEFDLYIKISKIKMFNEEADPYTEEELNGNGEDVIEYEEEEEF
jgi:hypothetical protein